MSFKVTNEQVEELVNIELENALEQSDKYHSDHEFYGILKEEIEEADKELDRIKFEFGCMWIDIKDNCKIDNCTMELKKYTIECIKELLQVASVCDKYLINKEKEKNNE